MAKDSYDDQINALQKQKQTNADVKKVKDYLFYAKEQTPGKDAPYSRFRDPSGAMAKERLDERGVDTESLITGKPSANEDYKKGGKIKYHKKGGAAKSSASKRADGCIEKGHTKGKYL